MRYPPYVSDENCNQAVTEELFDGRAEEEKKYEDCEEDNVLRVLVDFAIELPAFYSNLAESLQPDIDESVSQFAKFSAAPDSELHSIPEVLLRVLCWLFDAPMHVIQARYTEVKVMLEEEMRVAEPLTYVCML
jgi:hypothetical protein